MGESHELSLAHRLPLAFNKYSRVFPAFSPFFRACLCVFSLDSDVFAGRLALYFPAYETRCGPRKDRV